MSNKYTVKAGDIFGSIFGRSSKQHETFAYSICGILEQLKVNNRRRRTAAMLAKFKGPEAAIYDTGFADGLKLAIDLIQAEIDEFNDAAKQYNEEVSDDRPSGCPEPATSRDFAGDRGGEVAVAK